ncbi:flavodoxin [Feifania hominis]|uniref:NAD(P)H-dependent oxidoreductase n=1 Tax=Feifania hominis TaxID=2763660 RepID=A0A926HUI0_9FIRM|nr:flavodoxin [Feifania hominis]MBC8536313.1 NAD(P)H-dependent oxidoreductase [Feifania hominis]
MKRVLSLLLALLLAVSLAACGTLPAPETPDTPTDTPTDPPSQNNGAQQGEAPQADPDPTQKPGESSTMLVVYFSATGTTEGVAQTIAEATGADLFEIVPETPYSDADLNYNADCRANDEQQDDAARPAIASDCTVAAWDRYDVIFLGYPIWWGIPPKIMRTFCEQYDWSGKTVVPFCTSGGSGFSSEGLPELTAGAEWLDGRRFRSGLTQEDVTAWLEERGLSSPLSVQSTSTLSVRCGDISIVYELNDSPAARALLAQLPLTLEVEPFGSNEQTFYPPEELPTSDTPDITSATAGTLAYYAPWGDVVMFYGDLSGGSSGVLFELGKAISGTEEIANLSGTITVY